MKHSLKALITGFFSLLMPMMIWCQQATPSSTTQQLTSISGKIDKTKAKEVGLQFYRDFISLEEELYSIPLDTAGYFSMEFLLKSPMPVKLFFQGKSIKLYLEPGDSIAFDIQAERFPAGLAIKGKGAKHNACLVDLQRRFPERKSDFIDFEIIERSSMEFRRFMDNLHSRQLAFFKQYDIHRSEPLSVGFRNYLLAEIDYWWAYHLLRFSTEHEVSNPTAVSDSIPAKYFSFLNHIVINNEDALRNIHYVYFLEKYLEFERDRPVSLLGQANFLKPSYVVTVPSVLLMAGPDQGPVYEEIRANARLRYLGEESEKVSKIMIRNVLMEGNWLKVRTASGKTGWVHRVGVKQDEPSVLANLKKGPSTERQQQAAQHLRGKALYYSLASQLYWQTKGDSIQQLKKKFDTFLALNQDPTYDQILKAAFDEAARRSFITEQYLYGTTRYLDFEGPRIISKIPEWYEQERIRIQDPGPAVHRAFELTSPVEARPIVATIIRLQPEGIVEQVEAKNKDTLVVASLDVIKNRQDRLEVVQESDFIDIDNVPVMDEAITTTISTRFDQIAPSAIQFVTYSDPFLMQEQTHTFVRQSDGNYQVDLELLEPTIGYLKFGNEQTNLLLNPGDELSFVFSPSSFLNSLQFMGKGNEANIYLRKKALQFKDIDKQIRKKMEVMDEAAFVKEVEKLHQEQLTLLTDFQKNSPLPRAFLTFAKADIDFWKAYQLLTYPWERPFFVNQDPPLKVSDTYFDFLKELDISQEEALPGKYYIYFIDQYMNHLRELPENEELEDLALGQKYLNGAVLNYYTAKSLAMSCRRGRARQLGASIQQFIDNCPIQDYNNVLRFVYNDARGLVKGMKAPDFSLVDINGKSVRLSSFRGKVIYLDFWASWCLPCVHQMRNSQQWKAKFKNKDVVFVYVSLDKEQATWKNFVHQQSLPGIHLIAKSPSVYQSRVARLYKVSRLPALFLIDKSGKIVYNSGKDAVGPALAEQIELLLLAN